MQGYFFISFTSSLRFLCSSLLSSLFLFFSVCSYRSFFSSFFGSLSSFLSFAPFFFLSLSPFPGHLALALGLFIPEKADYNERPRGGGSMSVGMGFVRSPGFIWEGRYGSTQIKV